MGSETLSSACYILSDEYSIPFYSTSNGYNNIEMTLASSVEQLNSIFKLTVFKFK